MKVILFKDLGKFGSQGDVVEVKDGYARNHLIPKGFALAASDSNNKMLEEIKKAKLKMVQKEKEKFFKQKDEIEKISLTIAVEAKENEELYGSISEAQILKLLEAEGLELEKGKLVLSERINKLGVFNLKVNLHSEVEANLRVWIVKK
jgi:large subunit ribosomal protein L9